MRSSNTAKLIKRYSIEQHSATAKINRPTSRVDREISNIADKVADINPIFLQFKIQNQVVRLKWDIDSLHLCG
jgi:hypothetical protein